jgi:hypothetical protein
VHETNIVEKSTVNMDKKTLVCFVEKLTALIKICLNHGYDYVTQIKTDMAAGLSIMMSMLWSTETIPGSAKTQNPTIILPNSFAP